jgi:RNA polymerase sigma factor for flagellar operon FliA
MMAQHAHALAVRPARPVKAEMLELWRRYARERDGAVREELAHAYMEFARIMAAKAYAQRAYPELEFGDYLQYAHVGLLESIDRFEPERDIKFETFAAPRIQGAILNGIACSSEIQEQIAARRRILAARVGSLRDGTGPQDVFARLAEIAIGLAVGFALEESGMVQAEGAEYPDNSYHGVEMKQLQARVRAALAQLVPGQRQVIESHYLQQQPFEEVATAMRLSRGRIAQLHKEALGNLRARLLSLEGVDLLC